MKHLWIILSITCILVFGCQSNQGNAEEKVEKKSAQLLPFTILSKGYESPFTEGTDMIIDNQKTLDSIWQILYSHLSLPPDPPQINFEAEQVVAVFLGEYPTTGYWITIDSVYNTNTDMILAFTTSTSISENLEVIQFKTQPYVIATIPKTEKDIKFDFKEQE